MVSRICRRCNCQFEARQADVNRGWALYCSKSCKAIYTKGNRTKKKKQNQIRHDGQSPMRYKNCWCGDSAVNGVHTITGIEWLCRDHLDEAHAFHGEDDF